MVQRGGGILIYNLHQYTITNVYLMAKIQTDINVNLSKKSSFLLDDLASLSSTGRFLSQIGQKVRTNKYSYPVRKKVSHVKVWFHSQNLNRKPVSSPSCSVHNLKAL